MLPFGTPRLHHRNIRAVTDIAASAGRDTSLTKEGTP